MSLDLVPFWNSGTAPVVVLVSFLYSLILNAGVVSGVDSVYSGVDSATHCFGGGYKPAPYFKENRCGERCLGGKNTNVLLKVK